MKYLKKGFTLIELIIVMAVLGILAAGLIAVLDPVEQLNRTSDNGARTNAGEILRAAQRYYGSNQKWPASPTTGISTDLVNAGELKKDISSLTIGGNTYAFTFYTGLTNTSGVPVNGPFVCFTTPKSKQYKNDAAGAYTTAPTDCTRASGLCTAAATGTDGTLGVPGTVYCVKG